jgi:hypothetical protein
MPLVNKITGAITLDTIRAARTGFAKPLVLAQSTDLPAGFTDRFREYAGTDEAIDDGISSSGSVVKALAAMFDQSPRPKVVGVGRRVAAVAQVYQYDITASPTDGDYTITINGEAHTFNAVSQTATQVRDELITAINAGGQAALVTAAIVDADSLSVTSDVAGLSFSTAVASPDGDLTQAQTTANTGAYEDLTAVKAEDDTWYGIVSTSRTDGDILETSRWAQDNKKLYVAQSDDTDIYDAGVTTDIASQLETLLRTRTVLTFHDDDSEMNDAGVAGKMFPKDAGSAHWGWQSINGAVADVFTSAQVTAIVNKSANYFEETDGVQTIFHRGMTSGGIWADLIIGADWLEQNINADLRDLLIAEDKVPYTDGGLAQIGTTIEARMRRGASQGIVTAESIDVPEMRVSDQESSDVANRHLVVRDIRATIQGAVDTIDWVGTLSLPTAA